MKLFQLHREQKGPNPLPGIPVLAEDFEDALAAFRNAHGDVDIAAISVLGARPVISDKSRVQIAREQMGRSG